MILIPNHLKADFDTLSSAQKMRFMELASWSNTGLQSFTVSDVVFDKIFKMVKFMGEEPDTPVAPDLNQINIEWDSITKNIRK